MVPECIAAGPAPGQVWKLSDLEARGEVTPGTRDRMNTRNLPWKTGALGPRLDHPVKTPYPSGPPLSHLILLHRPGVGNYIYIHQSDLQSKVLRTWRFLLMTRVSIH